MQDAEELLPLQVDEAMSEDLEMREDVALNDEKQAELEDGVPDLQTVGLAEAEEFLGVPDEVQEGPKDIRSHFGSSQ